MNDHVLSEVSKLKRRFATRNPFELLDMLGVKVRFSTDYKDLKGYCFIANRIPFVIINDFLPEEEQRIVAAHELGHICLHRVQLQYAFMTDKVMYAIKDTTELEANHFAADLLLSDEEILEQMAETQDIFTMAKGLNTMPEMVAFKLRNMNKRGYNITVPTPLDSKFLAK